MDFIQIMLIGIVSTLLYLILKEVQPTYSFLLLLTTSIFILFIVVQQIGYIIQLIRSLGDQANIHSTFILIILKIIGIAYVTELASSVTRDAGLSSIASKLELAGKITIILLALPIITAVIDVITQFIPSSTWQLP